MTDIFQGSPLPSVTTTQESQITAPEFYTNYLQDIANLGQNAVQQGGVAGFSPLQQQAFQMAPQTSFAGAESAGQANQLLNLSGTTSAPSLVSNYMNPYTRAVVDEMGRLQQQNIQRNILPNLAAAGVSAGSFGSKRQAQATGQTLADMQANLLGQQANQLNTGYQNAITAAQNDLTRQMQSGQSLGNLANTQYGIGTGGLKTLFDLGQKQQDLGQKMLDNPMTQAQNFANLLHSYTMPTGTVQQTVGPGGAGAYSNSPLSQIAGLAALVQAIYGTSPTTTAQQDYGYIAAAAKNLGLTLDAAGNFVDANSNKFKWDGSQFVKAAEGGSINKYADGGNVAGIATDPVDQNYLPPVDQNVTQDPMQGNKFDSMLGTQDTGTLDQFGMPYQDVMATSMPTPMPSLGFPSQQSFNPDGSINNPYGMINGNLLGPGQNYNKMIRDLNRNKSNYGGGLSGQVFGNRDNDMRGGNNPFNPWTRPGQPTPMPSPQTQQNWQRSGRAAPKPAGLNGIPGNQNPLYFGPGIK